MRRTVVDERDLFNFIAHEARLLDQRLWDEWLTLFTDDGRYWVPLAGADQSDDGSSNSIADEDRLLLALRIERLKNPRAHSEHPPTRCQHVLQLPALMNGAASAGAYELHTPFIYVETRGGRQIVLAGSYRHYLVQAGGALRIRLKRVDLLEAGMPLPAIQLFP
jgi:3-phenylpropionate/cinnamic acid dioxygenase small subunit